MTPDDANDEILRLARDPALPHDALRDAVRAVLLQLTAVERAAVSERAQALLTDNGCTSWREAHAG